MPSYEHPEIRFNRMVDRRGETECWPWLGYVRPDGYGRFMLRARKALYAHRFAYEQIKGTIPVGLTIDHLCRNRRCVNPAHLEAVTQRENLERSPLIGKNKTICPRGHRHDGINKKGARICNRCRREKRQERNRSELSTMGA